MRIWSLRAIILMSMLLLIVLTMSAGLASAFFILPVMLGVAGWMLFFVALRFQRHRNPIAPPAAGARERWADGQPYTRCVDYQALRVIAAESAQRELDEWTERLRRDEEERESERAAGSGRDFDGPPPVNPFP